MIYFDLTAECSAKKPQTEWWIKMTALYNQTAGLKLIRANIVLPTDRVYCSQELVYNGKIISDTL